MPTIRTVRKVPNGGSAIQRQYFVVQELRQRGYDVQEDADFQPGDIIWLTKDNFPGLREDLPVDVLTNHTVVWDMCDSYLDSPRCEQNIGDYVIPYVDYIVTNTVPLRDRIVAALHERNLPLPPIEIIPDMVAANFSQPTFMADPNHIDIIWYGILTHFAGCPWETVLGDLAKFDQQITLRIFNSQLFHDPELYKDYIKQVPSNVKLIFYDFDVLVWRYYLAKADFMIHFFDDASDYYQMKSHNKVIDPLAAGTMPITNYCPDYAKCESFGYIVPKGKTLNLYQAMRDLIATPVKTLRRIKAGQQYVRGFFSPKKVNLKWVKFFKKVIDK